MNNAVRTTNPRDVWVCLSAHEGLTLAVRDDGTDTQDADVPRDSLGLHVLRCRTDIIGGNLSIHPAEDGGTLVECAVPPSRG